MRLRAVGGDRRWRARAFWLHVRVPRTGRQRTPGNLRLPFPIHRGYNEMNAQVTADGGGRGWKSSS